MKTPHVGKNSQIILYFFLKPPLITLCSAYRAHHNKVNNIPDSHWGKHPGKGPLCSNLFAGFCEVFWRGMFSLWCHVMSDWLLFGPQSNILVWWQFYTLHCTGAFPSTYTTPSLHPSPSLLYEQLSHTIYILQEKSRGKEVEYSFVATKT